MMEFALPFALRLFPNLLPSTFEEKHQREEKRVKLLKVRLEMAQLMEHTLEERAAQVTAQEESTKRKKAEAEAEEAREASGDGGVSVAEVPMAVVQRDGAIGAQMPDDVRRFMVSMREGGGSQASTDELLSMMRGFKDNVTLDHLYRDQLVAMARFLGMNAFAPTAILRFQIRQRLKKLRSEDKEIMWEGVDTLRESELRQDLRARGLPTKSLGPDQMRTTLTDWLSLSQKKEIPYTLLILMNMLHFAGTREVQQSQESRTSATVTPEVAAAEINVDDAVAALSSLPSNLAEHSTLVSSVDVSDDEKLQALRREEELIEEERVVSESFVKAEEVEELLETGEEHKAKSKKAPKTYSKADADGKPKPEQLQLSHDQVGEIAEAVELMAADSPVAKERLEIDQLEREREGKRETIEEGKKRSSQVAMLDNRVSRLLENLRAELKETETSIGDAFHSLDLDGDGVLSHDELLTAMKELNVSKRPDAAAFQELLDQLDVDADGNIPVEDFRRLIRDMQMRSEDPDDEPTPAAKQRQQGE